MRRSGYNLPKRTASITYTVIVHHQSQVMPIVKRITACPHIQLKLLLKQLASGTLQINYFDRSLSPSCFCSHFCETEKNREKIENNNKREREKERDGRVGNKKKK